MTIITEAIEVKICKACFWKRFFLKVILSYLLTALIAILVASIDYTLIEQIEFANENLALIIFVGSMLALLSNAYIIGSFFGKFISFLRKTDEVEAYINNAIVKQNRIDSQRSRSRKNIRYFEYFFFTLFIIWLLYFSIFKRKDGFDFFDYIFGAAAFNFTLIIIKYILLAVLKSCGMFKNL